MIYRQIANSEKTIKIPIIGQGTTGTGGYQKLDYGLINKRIETLRFGIDLGMTFIDTSELYGGGLGEEVAGKAITGQRDKIFLSSKFTPKPDIENSIRNSLEGSLKRLGTDYIDLYQMHWPDPTISISRVMETLDKISGEGKVRFVGLSNFSLMEFQEAESCLEGKNIISNQMEYNLSDRSIEKDMLPYFSQKNLIIIAYSALNQGKLFRSIHQNEILKTLSEKYNKTIPQIILNWVIRHYQIIVVTKSKSMARTKENALASDFQIEKKDIEKINNISEEYVEMVEIGSIKLSADDNRIYTTMDEALENKMDLIPSPFVLSQIIMKINSMKPIRLNLINRPRKYKYQLDSYDLFDNVKKYWAWKLAYKNAFEIPAYIV